MQSFTGLPSMVPETPSGPLNSKKPGPNRVKSFVQLKYLKQAMVSNKTWL